MPYSVPNTFVDGESMLDASVRSNLSAYRTWLNGGMVVADLADDGIPTSRVYDQDLFGFPMEGARGPVSGSYGVDHTNDPGLRPNERQRRVDLRQELLDEEDMAFVPSLSKTLFVPANSRVKVSASFHVMETHDYRPASGGSGGAPIGARQSAGRMAFVHRQRGDSSWTTATPWRYALLSSDEVRDPQHNNAIHALCWFDNTASEGATHDLAFVWQSTGADAGIELVSVFRASMSIQMHRL